MLKRQIMDESEQINETLKENSYVCHKYGIDISVPGEIDDDSADLLVHAVERMANAANDKYGTKSDSLSRSTETRSSIQQKVSEKTALQRHNERNPSAHEHKITELKAQIDEDQRTLQELRGHADILRQVSISAINPHFSGPFCYQYFPTRIQAFQF